jgi:hypothetical protein
MNRPRIACGLAVHVGIDCLAVLWCQDPRRLVLSLVDVVGGDLRLPYNDVVLWLVSRQWCGHLLFQLDVRIIVGLGRNHASVDAGGCHLSPWNSTEVSISRGDTVLGPYVPSPRPSWWVKVQGESSSCYCDEAFHVSYGVCCSHF